MKGFRTSSDCLTWQAANFFGEIEDAFELRTFTSKKLSLQSGSLSLESSSDSLALVGSLERRSTQQLYLPSMYSTVQLYPAMLKAQS
jgi:hypothetical protein